MDSVPIQHHINNFINKLNDIYGIDINFMNEMILLSIPSNKCLNSSKMWELCKNYKCGYCFNRSFESSNRAEYWSPENDELPRHVFKSSNKKYKFVCKLCLHTFDSSLNNIKKGNWCPYCISKKLCDSEDCQYCFNKSFASSKKVKYWSPENSKNPRHVFKSSDKKFKFNCDKCSHTFETMISDIKGGKWCPYCSNQKLCGNACEYCYRKSFASIDKAKYWSSENIKIPRQVFRSSGKKYKFSCDKCFQLFEASPANVIRGKWCSYCRQKTEKIFMEHLNLYYPNLRIKRQYRADWCRSIETGRTLPFDFLIEDLKLIIEIDGPQHFEQISNWASPKFQKERDIFKIKQAHLNGYSMIRILQKDIFQNLCNWKELFDFELKLYPKIETTLKLIGNNQDLYSHFQ